MSRKKPNPRTDDQLDVIRMERPVKLRDVRVSFGGSIFDAGEIVEEIEEEPKLRKPTKGA